MKCEVCGAWVWEVALFRNGPKDERGPWRCLAHVEGQWRPPYEVVEALVNFMEKGNETHYRIL